MSFFAIIHKFIIMLQYNCCITCYLQKLGLSTERESSIKDHRRPNVKHQTKGYAPAWPERALFQTVITFFSEHSQYFKIYRIQQYYQGLDGVFCCWATIARKRPWFLLYTAHPANSIYEPYRVHLIAIHSVVCQFSYLFSSMKENELNSTRLLTSDLLFYLDFLQPGN